MNIRPGKLLAAAFLLISAAARLHAEKMDLYLFVQEGCPNCEAAEIFIEKLQNEFPGLEVRSFDIEKDPRALAKFNLAVTKLHIKTPGLPLILFGEYYFSGAGGNVFENLALTVSSYKTKPFSDKMGPLLENRTGSYEIFTNPSQNTLAVPLLGEFSLDNLPVAASTALIAFADGFNPCSLWVLTLVLGIAIQSRKRKNVLLAGLVFLIVTSLIYGAFLAGAVRIVAVLMYSSFFNIIIILFIAAFAMLNIKDYFLWKKGPSMTINEHGKNVILKRLRKALNPSSGIITVFAGTAVLAAAAAFIELPCTAGFPLIWARVLAETGSESSLWFLLPGYLLVYLLDELLVLAFAFISMKRFFVDEKKGRSLKLAAGVLMASLAVHLLMLNSLLKSAWGILSVIGSSVLAGGVLVIIRKKTEGSVQKK